MKVGIRATTRLVAFCSCNSLVQQKQLRMVTHAQKIETLEQRMDGMTMVATRLENRVRTLEQRSDGAVGFESGSGSQAQDVETV